MFLNTLLKVNPALADFSVYLHKKGLILPDTYVLDLDAFLENFIMIKKQAAALGIEIYPMIKQLGRSQYLIRELINEKFVTVDFREALHILNHKGKLGHVGHLVQIPYGLQEKLISARPDYVTVYSLEAAEKIAQIAQALGITQKILLRIVKEPYPSQESELFSSEWLINLARNISKLKGVQLCGLTSFPCFLYKNNEIILTPNGETLNEAYTLLQNEGYPLTVKNMPSHTSLSSLPLLSKYQASHGEPGHALTGTCPYHAEHHDEEKIALCYISEISHHSDKKSFCYGGGWYRRSHWKEVLINKNTASIYECAPDSIDYSIAIEGLHPIGETVLASFRTQIFTTRSMLAVVSGLSSANPKLAGITDANGRSLEE